MNRRATAECRFCQQWEPAPEDTFCSFCGRLLLLLDVAPETTVLISTIAPSKELTLRNGGPRAMQVTIDPRIGAAIPGVTFEPAQTLTIPPDGEERVRVHVDAQKLPAGYQRIVDYVCIVDGDLRKQRVFKLDVRSGPSPRLLTPMLDFDEVEEGKTVQRSLELSNIGSITLRIRSVRAEGSPHLLVRGDYADRLLKKGEKLSIPVAWETTVSGNDPADGTVAGVRIEFANHADVLFAPAVARMFRYRLDVKPTAIRVGQALTKREYPHTVRLENGGTTDVEITSIESDRSWIAVVSRATTLTLLCKESAPTKPASPTTFARSLEFKIVCRPNDLPVGKHRGRVTISPHGQEPIVIPVEINVVQPKEYHDYVGIDFGTSNSVVAVLSPREKSGVALVKDELSGKDLIPSVLVFDDLDTYKIGSAAKNEASAAPDRTVRSIKRVMGYEQDRTFFDRPYAASELASLIIRKLVHLAEEKLHADSGNGTHFTVRKAIITVPANFHDLQIRDVLEACAAAGLDTEEEKARKAEALQSESLGEMVNAGIILDEPSAAVLYYLDFLRRTRSTAEIAKAIAREKGLKLLVFDYGGGTLDVAVASATQVKTGGTGLRILANMGNNDIGGDHIDVLVMNELLRRCAKAIPEFEFDTTLISCTFKDLLWRSESEGWSPEVWRRVLYLRTEWKDIAEQVKIAIAEKKQTAIKILPKMMVRVVAAALVTATKQVSLDPLSEATVKDLLHPVLATCEELVRSSLTLAEVGIEDIDFILHTGRQSLLPHIRQRVRSIFPHLGDDRDLLEEKHLKICVAKGAALYGSMRDRLVEPTARILLLSDGRRLPHSYGVEKFTNPVDPEFDEVIERGAKYPIERTKLYPANMIPPGGYLNLRFFQNVGVHKHIIGNPQVSLIGQISINTEGKDHCDVTVAVGANRTLHVSANGAPVNIEPARLHEEESWMG